MNIIKKLKIKLSVALFALIAVALVGVALTAKSWSGEAPKVVVEGNYIEAEQPLPPQDDEILGAVVSELTMGPEICNADDCTFHLTGDLLDATNTLFYVANPFRAVTSSASDIVIENLATGKGLTGATSTVELVRIYVDGPATTTYNIGCSSAPTRYVTSTAGNTILQTGVIVTSSVKFVVENNLGAVAASGNAVATDSVSKILLGPSNPYLVCRAFQQYNETNTAFTNAENTFSGHFVVRVSRQRF